MAEQREMAEYLPPNPHYLQMVVDYVETVLTQAGAKTKKGAKPASVVFDMHNYMRWCPMGIGGTWSCLEEAGYGGKIQYDTSSITACPSSQVFPNHASFENVCPKTQTPEQAANYWDKQPDAADFNGTPDYGMGGQGG